MARVGARWDRPVDPTWESAQNRFGLLGVIAAAVCLVDQATKDAIYTSIGPVGTTPGQQVTVVPDLVRLSYVSNRGAAFGLLDQFGDLFTPLVVGIMILVLLYYRSLRGPRLLMRCALSLQLGGAMGNLLDRLRYGHVIDFVDVPLIPVFNVADSAIFLGSVILVGLFVLRPDS